MIETDPPALVLIVEDDPIQAKLLHRSLTQAGYRVTVARNGEEGLAAARREAPAVVVTDISMPVMDGYAMCQAIRQDEALKDTPLIVLTALSNAREVIRGLNAGADFYVTKPHHEAYLLSRIRAAMELAPRRAEEKLEMETLVDGKRLKVRAWGGQMLSLLVSVYENAVLQNQELSAAEEKLLFLNRRLEEKVAEETAALKKSEARLSALLEASPVCMFETDLQGACLYVNDRWTEITGLPREQAYGWNWAQALHPEDRERILAKWRELLLNGLPDHDEFRFLGPRGETRWVYAQVVPLRDERRNVTGYMGSLTEITEQKRAEEDISRLGAVVQQAGDAVVITDLKGAIVYVNPYFERLSGYTAAEVIGQNMRILKSGYLNDLVYRQLWETISAGEVWRGQLVNRRKDGSLFHEESCIFPVKDGRGRIINYASVKKDVTTRMEAEAKIRKLSRLYATLSAVNQIILRAKDRDELFREICQSGVESGGFALCWVGLVDEADRTVKPFCHHGREEGYLSNIFISIDDIPEGRGPTGACIREDRAVYVNDYAADERTLPWREAALRQGLRGAAAVPIRREGRVIGALTLYADEPDFFDREQMDLLEELAADISFALEGFEREVRRVWAEEAREAALTKLRNTLSGTIQLAAATIEMRDPYTAGHQQRVARLAVAISRELGLDEDRIAGIHFGCLIHDIGKIYVPSEILSKPGKLSELEMAIIRGHAQIGYEIVRNVDFPWPVAQMILQHHERLDGSGYPHGAKGEEIILEARIIAVADVVEAMSSHRPYRAGLGMQLALADISSHRGVRYDAQTVDACLRLFNEKGFRFSEAV